MIGAKQIWHCSDPAAKPLAIQIGKDWQVMRIPIYCKVGI